MIFLNFKTKLNIHVDGISFQDYCFMSRGVICSPWIDISFRKMWYVGWSDTDTDAQPSIQHIHSSNRFYGDDALKSEITKSFILA